MKYGLIQRVFWAAFKGTFERELTDTLCEREPKKVMKRARAEYRRILSDVDEFEKGDRFLFNILSASMFSAVLLNLKRKPSTEQAREYYRAAMSSNILMQRAAKKSKSYTEKGRAKLKADAEKSRNQTNPYSWKFTVEDGETINQYTATFYTCGICYLLTKLGLKEYIPRTVQLRLRYGGNESYGVYPQIHDCRRGPVLRLPPRSYAEKTLTEKRYEFVLRICKR